MSRVESGLNELSLTLPPVQVPGGTTLPFPWAIVRGDRALISSHGPTGSRQYRPFLLCDSSLDRASSMNSFLPRGGREAFGTVAVSLGGESEYRVSQRGPQ
jgi:hypothetical protein